MGEGVRSSGSDLETDCLRALGHQCRRARATRHYQSRELAQPAEPAASRNAANHAQDPPRPQLEAKQIRFAVDHNGVTHLTGDSQHLSRVFMNLLSNAIKYTPDKGTIRVQFRKDNGTILASVSDTGHGIKSEELPKLFQEFYRATDPINQEIRGTGLGLALVKRIVEAHGGEISVASEYGKGTTFTVRLPESIT